MQRPIRRTVWSLLEKVLNKALDYDARILHPEVFSNFALRLDSIVLCAAADVMGIADLTSSENACLRLRVENRAFGWALQQRRFSTQGWLVLAKPFPAFPGICKKWGTRVT